LLEKVEGVEKLKWLQGWLIEILFFEKIGFLGFRVPGCKVLGFKMIW